MWGHVIQGRNVSTIGANFNTLQQDLAKLCHAKLKAQ